jgi:hypothetical protein
MICLTAQKNFTAISWCESSKPHKAIPSPVFLDETPCALHQCEVHKLLTLTSQGLLYTYSTYRLKLMTDFISTNSNLFTAAFSSKLGKSDNYIKSNIIFNHTSSPKLCNLLPFMELKPQCKFTAVWLYKFIISHHFQFPNNDPVSFWSNTFITGTPWSCAGV